MSEREPKPVAGRMPPHSLEAEAAVLSAMLCSAEACDEALDVVRAEDFYSDANRTVALAIVDLHGKGEPVDPVVVAEWLRGRELIQRVGGAVYLANLVDATPAVANVRAHATIVRELRHVRAWVATAQRWAAQGYDAAAQADPAGYIQAAALDYQRVLDDTAGEDVRPLREWLKVVVDRSTQLSENHEQLAGCDTGLEALNESFASRLARLGITWDPQSADWHHRFEVEREIDKLDKRLDKRSRRALREHAQQLVKALDQLDAETAAEGEVP